MSDTPGNGHAPATSSRTVTLRASEDGVEVETADSAGSEIVLIPWDQAVKVGRQLIYLARERGDVT